VRLHKLRVWYVCKGAAGPLPLQAAGDRYRCEHKLDYRQLFGYCDNDNAMLTKHNSRVEILAESVSKTINQATMS
jgi:hypothetical protein